MTQRDNILQELKELESSLTNLSSQNTYSVPAGYFEGLAAQVLSRIKAMESGNAVEELSHLSSLLSHSSRQMPYDVPVGYFEGLEERVLQAVRASSSYQSAKEELETLSPLLSGLKKEMPYSIPQGYFENLPAKPQTKTKVVSLGSRRWFRYAAAAVLVGALATTGLFLIKQNNRPSEKQIMAKVNKEVNKMNETEKDNLVDFLNAGLNGSETAQVNPDKTNDFKEFLKDIPEEELKAFGEQNEDLRDLLQISE